MIRALDLIFALIGAFLFLPIFLIILIIGFIDTGKPVFIQERIGKNKKPFNLFKFRTMYPNTKSVATHLVDESTITSIGKVLRKTKLDELPQLFNVLKGDMSLVGPRPNLLNQVELIEEREKRNIYKFRPGITGLAQINEIDMSTPKLLAETDAKMLKNLNLKNYFKYIFLTIGGKGQGDRVQRM